MILTRLHFLKEKSVTSGFRVFWVVADGVPVGTFAGAKCDVANIMLYC